MPNAITHFHLRGQGSPRRVFHLQFLSPCWCNKKPSVQVSQWTSRKSTVLVPPSLLAIAKIPADPPRSPGERQASAFVLDYAGPSSLPILIIFRNRLRERLAFALPRLCGRVTSRANETQNAHLRFLSWILIDRGAYAVGGRCCRESEWLPAKRRSGSTVYTNHGWTSSGSIWPPTCDCPWAWLESFY